MTAAEYQEMLKKPKQSKYRAEKTVVDGHRFDSKLEANYYCELKLLERMGEVTNIELQPKFELHGGIRYIADFRVTYADGHEEIVDCKGFKTAVYRMKKKLFAEKYPHLKIVEVSA
jgi:hypothetical protein